MYSNGYVHNDIKPANLMTDKGLKKIYLIDFGLSQGIKDRPYCSGSPFYMSPNKLIPGPLTYRDDLYSTAITIAVLEMEKGNVTQREDRLMVD